MIEKDDWRLTAGPVRGSEDRLKNIPLYYIPFQPLSESWDHEHCIFCWAKFYRHPECLQEGYCTRPANNREADWICPECYEDFKEMFGWTLEAPEKVPGMGNVAEHYIAALEGQKVLLYSDPSNPYESIYIRIEVKDGMLTLSDDECEHSPDGGWSRKWWTFDRENTRKFFEWICEGNRDPVTVLTGMVGYAQRTRLILDGCGERGIQNERHWAF